MAHTSFGLQVTPNLPPALRRLDDLAGNFWFSWYPSIGQLFRKLDSALWRKVESSPRLFLRCVDPSVLENAAADPELLREYQSVLAAFDRYLGSPPPRAEGLVTDDLIAYFCAEYGWHESFPIYSGGLGALAGDHCKTASDLGLPFVAVGLSYRQGYFNQRIDRAGQQVPEYSSIDPRNTPLVLATRPDGTEIRVSCPAADRTISVRVWKAPVGRVTVLLLDSDVPENSAEDRRVTYRLYGGDEELRVQQEIVLGIGGVRALRALGLAPTVWHINEGHAAFSVLERIRELTAQGVPFAAALEAVAASTVFTTHTPVSAGHDRFPLDRVMRQLQSVAGEFGVAPETVLDLGRSAEHGDLFNMTRLAISAAGAVNGVSKIHGRVSSRLCQDVWPDVPPEENPVGYVTNGIHVATFLRATWAALFDLHLGLDWRDRIMDRTLLNRILEIPDDLFWQTSQKVKSQMLRVLRERLTRQYQRNGLSEAHVHRLLKLADPDRPNVLTIGFARRFATYKRATLLLADLGWLEQIVGRRGPTGRVRVRRQGTPGGRAGAVDAARDPANLEPAAVHRQDLAAGGLRHGHQPRPDVRRRRLAEHARASFRGERHVGDEGGHQRHGEPERARRLVGGGLRRPQGLQERLGHSAGARRSGRGGSRSTGLDDAVRDSAGRGRAAVLRARRAARLFARRGCSCASARWPACCPRSTASACCATTCSRSTFRRPGRGERWRPTIFALRATSAPGKPRSGRPGRACSLRSVMSRRPR